MKDDPKILKQPSRYPSSKSMFQPKERSLQSNVMNSRVKYYTRLGIFNKQKHFFAWLKVRNAEQRGSYITVDIDSCANEYIGYIRDAELREPISIKAESQPLADGYLKQKEEEMAFVREFVFRGDNRSIEDIQKSNGFWCRESSENADLTRINLENHIENSNGHFVSTTRSIPVAKFFAQKYAKENGQLHGYVFCMLADHGINSSNELPISQHMYEQEISIHCGVELNKVVAYRALNSATGLFTGPLHVSTAAIALGILKHEHFAKIYDALSGNIQPIDKNREHEHEFIFTSGY